MSRYRKRVLRAEKTEEETSKRRRRAKRSCAKASEERHITEEGVFYASGSFYIFVSPFLRVCFTFVKISSEFIVMCIPEFYIPFESSHSDLCNEWN